MKAVYLEEYGNSQNLTFGDIAKPTIAPNQVLIKVQGAGVNPVDWMVREGFLQASGQHKMPLIVGWDAAGQVVEKGNNVSNLKLGEQVYVYAPISEQGAYAEYLAVDSDLVASAPKSLDIVTAAAVPLAATTAWQALVEGCQIKAGQRVLIHNASGGVGSFAVQIAKSLGAYVIGTASSSNKAYLMALGVDQFIDYQTQRFEDEVDELDAVLVAVGGDGIAERSLEVVRKGGNVVSLLDDIESALPLQLGVNFQRWWVSPNARDLQRIAALIDDGVIKVNIDKVFPLSKAAQAQELSQSKRARGKIVLEVSL
ncbi:NADP-dependent oxidoreductase [Vibrio splendidus]|uniref:NADP-dependent oxidoreductase n=1 Tax=Vibrio splendidus TaxID=29497 RepID=UPI001C0660F2|nr:NADP-dependent oxidoreductase [Vibrio splendidus]MBU2908699.1 NADP-dependent oxidoreductase [Vibrio splendidus]MDO6528483.1 NADP-dependent oxidoreductase [Vibrio splendidus]MDO6549538.1 NADP-dependent oxidoreductase [Vibrio splendidus]